MALEIKWSKTSRDDLYKITTYLEEFLSDIEFINYVDNVFDCLNTIASFPQIGIVASKKKKLRSFLISKHLRVYNVVGKSDIELASFTDTRTNPKNYPK